MIAGYADPVQAGPEVAFAWQGGEPTLMGRDFLERAVALAENRRQPHRRVTHTLQTNAAKLDEAWRRGGPPAGVMAALRSAALRPLLPA